VPIGIVPFFFQLVLREDGLYLLVAHGEASGTKTCRDGARAVLGCVDYREQDVDHSGRVQGRRDSLHRLRLRRLTAPLCELRLCVIRVRVEVDVHRLYLLAPERVRLDETAERVVNTQPQKLRQFLMRTTSGRRAHQHDDGGSQRAVLREADPADSPQSMRVELRLTAQRVVAARVAVARQIACGLQGEEDGRA